MQSPSQSNMFHCHTCAVPLLGRPALAAHYKAPWHLYNLKRRMHSLNPVSEIEFQKKLGFLSVARQCAAGLNESDTVEDVQKSVVSEIPVVKALVLTAKEISQRPSAHLRRPQEQADSPSTQNDALSGATAHTGVKYKESAAFAAWQKNIRAFPERMSFFDTHPPFSRSADNLRYMQKTYGFQIPDSEYLPVRFRDRVLKRIWAFQMRTPRCFLCEKRFSSIVAAQSHMRDKEHTSLKWDDSPSEIGIFQEEINGLFDYTSSYLQLLANFNGQEPHLSLISPPTDSSEPIKESGSCFIADDHKYLRTDDDDECISECSEGDWEDIESDKSLFLECELNLQNIIRLPNSVRKQKLLERVLHERGWRNASLTENGDLHLPNGKVAMNRNRLRTGVQKYSSSLACVALENKRTTLTLGYRTTARPIGVLSTRKIKHESRNRSGRSNARHYQRMTKKFDLSIGEKGHKLQRCILKQTKVFL